MRRVVIGLLGRKKKARATRCQIGRAGLNDRAVCACLMEVVIARH
jgi:hypothetical protein